MRVSNPWISAASRAQRRGGNGTVRGVRRWTRRRRGAVIVELAAVTPFLVLLVFGMIEATRLCMATQLLTTAAREGCRVAVSNGTTGSDAVARVQDYLDSQGISSAGLVITVNHEGPTLQETTVGEWVRVTVRVPFTEVNWMSSPFLFGNTTVSGSATMSSERSD